jgi:hypothetical protein
VASSFQVFQQKYCMHFSSFMCATCLIHVTRLDLIILIIFSVTYKLWSPSLCSLPQPPATSSLLGPNILHYTLLLKTLNLIFKFIEVMGRQKTMNRTVANITQIYLFLISMNPILICHCCSQIPELHHIFKGFINNQ